MFGKPAGPAAAVVVVVVIFFVVVGGDWMMMDSSLSTARGTGTAVGTAGEANATVFLSPRLGDFQDGCSVFDTDDLEQSTEARRCCEKLAIFC